MRAIIIEGASTAYGMDAGDYGGWVAQLHRDRQAYNKECRCEPEVVINHALPGLTLPYFNRRFEETVAPLVKPASDAVRILSVGLNEAKIMPGIKRPILTLGRFSTELATYAEDSARLNLPTIYVGSQPINEAKTKPVPTTGITIEDDLVEEYDAATKAQAEMTAMPFVDVRALFEGHDLDEVLTQDGYHPNELGHKLIYGRVQEALSSVVAGRGWGAPIPYQGTHRAS